MQIEFFSFTTWDENAANIPIGIPYSHFPLVAMTERWTLNMNGKHSKKYCSAQWEWNWELRTFQNGPVWEHPTSTITRGHNAQCCDEHSLSISVDVKAAKPHVQMCYTVFEWTKQFVYDICLWEVMMRWLPSILIISPRKNWWFCLMNGINGRFSIFWWIRSDTESITQNTNARILFQKNPQIQNITNIFCALKCELWINWILDIQLKHSSWLNIVNNTIISQRNPFLQ